jgi:hypothetical protein
MKKIFASVSTTVSLLAVISALLFLPFANFAGADSIITVISPNGSGSDQWQKGTVHNIVWSAPSSISTVSISAYNNVPCGAAASGKFCQEQPTVQYTITSSTPNNGTFAWTVGQAMNQTMPAGNYSITVFAADGSVATPGTSAVTIVDQTPPPAGSIAITTSSSLNAQLGQQFYATFMASGGTANYSWNVTAGSLPPGLQLLPVLQPLIACPVTGGFTCSFPQNLISLAGAPTQTGSFQFQLTATDQNNNSGSAWFAVNVYTGPPPPPPVCPANGAVIKYADSATVYSVENGMKRPYPSAQIFLSWNPSFAVIVIVPRDCQFPDGALKGFADGKLIKGSGPTVYLVSGGMLRPFPSAAVFFRLGYSFKQIMLVSDGDLSLQGMGAVME